MSRTRRDQSPFDVSGRTVFITGAARGIGAATAQRLHAKGANVALVGLEPERLHELAARLGDRAAAFEADVTDYDALGARSPERSSASAGSTWRSPTPASRSRARSRPPRSSRSSARWRSTCSACGAPTARSIEQQITKRRGYLLNISSLAAIAHAPMMGPYTSQSQASRRSPTRCAWRSPPAASRSAAPTSASSTPTSCAPLTPSASTQALTAGLPGFMRNPAPLSKAIDAIERGIERRSARLWAPRWVGPMIALRGLLQPLIERRILGEPERVAEAIRLTNSESGSAAEQDPVLGIAAQALESSTRASFESRATRSR